jgi:hypothetical protein
LNSHARAGDPIPVERVDGRRTPHPVDRSKLQMVLEVLAHARQVDGHRHVMFGQ